MSPVSFGTVRSSPKVDTTGVPRSLLVLHHGEQLLNGICVLEDALCWSCDRSELKLVWPKILSRARLVELRQNKRYRLKASVAFSWELPDGNSIQGEGHTRDISPAGVFVLTGFRPPLGASVKLEVVLPSLREEHSGACLRTCGHVVRAEEIGFAVVADMGFRMQFAESSASRQSYDKTDGDGRSKQEASRGYASSWVRSTAFRCK
jgi:PilZ domain